jgi:membrane-associated protease RseP (regulator of RpoE activity)
MNETPYETAEANAIPQIDFQQVSTLVSTEFQIEEALVEHNIPTYYLKYPQETKKAFLKLLKNLDPLNLIAILRKHNGRVVLKIIPKPPTKPSNILINWILFFATIATTFLTGYLISLGIIELAGTVLNPLVGGLAFTVAIMTVLGSHEMGHKLSADRKGIEATPPYFIPGPPPVFGIFGIGTFGAVIMQKSLPSNRDSLFDVGSSGPIIGFVLATIVTSFGLTLSISAPPSENVGALPEPLIFTLLIQLLSILNLLPQPLPDKPLLLVHPVALAGWVGLLITMLNLLPAAMLDGGHVARSLVGEKTRAALTFLSILLLIIEGFWPMAFFVFFMSMYRHPGPLDDVSSLSTSRKLLTVVLMAIFVLCSFPIQQLF